MFIFHDVVSLFTNTPVDLALQVIRERLEGDTELHTRWRLTVEDIMDLLKFIVTTTYFSFRGVIYQQNVRCRYGEPTFPASSQFVYGMAGEAGYCHGTG